MISACHLSSTSAGRSQHPTPSLGHASWSDSWNATNQSRNFPSNHITFHTPLTKRSVRQLLVKLKSNTVEVDRDNNNHSLPLFPCPLRMLGEYKELPTAVASTNSLSFVVCSCSRGCARHCSAEDGRTVDVQWSESMKNTAT